MSEAGVYFGDKHSFEDFNLMLKTIYISSPEPKTNNVDIPGGDGSIDLTESLTGTVKYKNRQMVITFIDPRIGFETSTQSVISNYLHGQKMRIALDDDLDHYYMGRCEVECYSNNSRDIVVTCDCEPYKYDKYSSTEEWLWDPFNFETGLIREYGDMVVEGILEVDIVGSRKPTVPIIIADTPMTVEFKGEVFELEVGENKILTMVLDDGINLMKFNGNGIVSVEFKGGSL